MSDLPTHHRALVLDSIGGEFQVKSVPVPQAALGSAIVRIAAAGVLSYHREVYNGERHYQIPTPLVGGMSAIGHIAAVGPDATSLRLGQLVYVDCVIHGRDDPGNLFLTAIHDGMTEGSKKLMRDVWRDGTFAEYARMPLENCIPLNETRLCRELGYSLPQLMYMCYLLVPFGGLRDIRLEPGETVIISPATGGYGGAGVQVAIAMGARVIAFGRNEDELARLKDHILKGSPKAEIEIVKMTGDQATDAAALQAFGPADAVLDFSPPAASKSLHVRSAIMALRRGGRVSLMGWNENVMHPSVMGRNITLKGKLMYERDEMLLFVKMLERGLFPRGNELVDVKTFELDAWKEGLDAGAEHIGIGRHVVFVP
ncbi:hypothetical protein LTR56_026271 [Elasticomyces elasticus]|nr:hypothetical protein LTR56_026271 [Elasticomyces elasticus]KAK3669105.1 hypothetical protein LTR22_000184 [Elasticomyces elasticus]KAK4920986.1 hypothetical protein LTR49_011530 [Elasticomyces elasticus]KAK5759509.1 hypothetical protein LTS12_010367 [Elasticomyces elasticus]